MLYLKNSVTKRAGRRIAKQDQANHEAHFHCTPKVCAQLALDNRAGQICFWVLPVEQFTRAKTI